MQLMFPCCHPALNADAQLALTLREVCGLTTKEIASAFLTGASIIAQCIVRAKAKIRDAKFPIRCRLRKNCANASVAYCE